MNTPRFKKIDKRTKRKLEEIVFTIIRILIFPIMFIVQLYRWTYGYYDYDLIDKIRRLV